MKRFYKIIIVGIFAFPFVFNGNYLTAMEDIKKLTEEETTKILKEVQESIKDTEETTKRFETEVDGSKKISKILDNKLNQWWDN